MSLSRTVELVAALGDIAHRLQAAELLARRLGGDELLLLLRDPDVDALVPAPGFPQTLRGGAEWRAFLARCTDGTEHAAMVDLPQGEHRAALGVARDGVVLVLLGGAPDRDELRALSDAMPLIGGLLRCEFRIAQAGAEASDARAMALRAQALSSALEAARAEHAKLNTELRDEHRRKDGFLAMLAHELRNPLSPLLTSLEILRHQAVSPVQRDKQLGVMARQVGQLSRLVEDLLDISRVSRGRIELKREPIGLRQVLDDALESCAPLLQARRHQLTTSLPPDPVMISADPVRMTQVFANLINNAA
ncbi:MAG: HAMP domain-containing sensor histidine kinase, partial [Burkholderiaceae bacterium]